MSYTKILIAYDGSETSKKALEKGVEIAKQNEKTEIKILTVWNIPVLAYEAYTYQDITDTYQELAEQNMNEAREVVEDLPNKKQVLVLKGHPASAIIDYADDEDVDLIIVGSRGLGGFQRFFLGSVSFQVAQQAECDVLIVK